MLALLILFLIVGLLACANYYLVVQWFLPETRYPSASGWVSTILAMVELFSYALLMDRRRGRRL